MISGRIGSVIGLVITFMLITVAGCFISLVPAAVVGIVLGLVQPLLGLFVGYGVFMFGILATVVVLLRFGVAIPALMLEQVTIAAALKRSALLTRGHRMRVLLIYFLMVLMSFVAAFLFQGPFLAAGFYLGGINPPTWTQALAAIFGGIGGAITGPLLMIGLALLYFDLRVRKEAFDLEIRLNEYIAAASVTEGGA